MNPRVATLLPSATEIVCALGMRANLVGRSHECDFPSDVLSVPALTESKLDVSSKSSEIDDRVKQAVAEGLSIYRVRGNELRRADPDVIVTQTQCEVCALTEREVFEAVSTYLDRDVRIVAVNPLGLEHIWTDFLAIAEAVGAKERGFRLVEHCQERMSEISARALSSDTRPRVATLEWIDPPMAGGNWMPELVAMAGGVNLFGEAGKHSPWLEWSQLVDSDPDVILVVPCGFDLLRTRREMESLAQREGWQDLTAVREGRVFLADGNAYFNRPGPRIVESLEMLAAALHPEIFPLESIRAGMELYSDLMDRVRRPRVNQGGDGTPGG